ncbi:Leucine Rich Repeat [Seminavis robusta]|uniref:Leucine Rich Repeat n=1 Tax=Seminavis robusta TaxID=568900 RepID=A0A9N8HDM2_9STRA|nr:Leucine Rich Repeat [Seminavis robusta]|eukprot:Sro467_g148980.1 Leucine Rich Repeat (859) ;mRNA; f:51016-53592
MSSHPHRQQQQQPPLRRQEEEDQERPLQVQTDLDERPRRTSLHNSHQRPRRPSVPSSQHQQQQQHHRPRGQQQEASDEANNMIMMKVVASRMDHLGIPASSAQSQRRLPSRSYNNSHLSQVSALSSASRDSTSVLSSYHGIDGASPMADLHRDNDGEEDPVLMKMIANRSQEYRANMNMTVDAIRQAGPVLDYVHRQEYMGEIHAVEQKLTSHHLQQPTEQRLRSSFAKATPTGSHPMMAAMNLGTAHTMSTTPSTGATTIATTATDTASFPIVSQTPPSLPGAYACAPTAPSLHHNSGTGTDEEYDLNDDISTVDGMVQEHDENYYMSRSADYLSRSSRSRQSSLDGSMSTIASSRRRSSSRRSYHAPSSSSHQQHQAGQAQAQINEEETEQGDTHSNNTPTNDENNNENNNNNSNQDDVEAQQPPNTQDTQDKDQKWDYPIYIAWTLLALTLIVTISAIVIVATKPDFIYAIGADNDDATHSNPPFGMGGDQDLLLPQEGGAVMLLHYLPELTQLKIEQDPTSPQSSAYNWLIQDTNFSQYPLWRHRQRFALAALYFSLRGNFWPPEMQETWLHHGVHECEWMTAASTPCNGKQGLYQRLSLDNIPQLVGRLPLEIDMLTGLREIRITRMSWNLTLSDFVPASAALLPKLQVMDYSHSNFQGSSIPAQLGQMTQLEELYLNNARLAGKLPTNLQTMASLDTLELNNNQFTGTIPGQWNAMTTLETINIDQNLLSGTLPVAWHNMTNLLDISLRNNNLTGTLPVEWGDLQQLVNLRLDHNHFQGTIPDSWEFPVVNAFGVDGNPDLEGSIPQKLCSHQTPLSFNVFADCEQLLCCGDVSQEKLDLQAHIYQVHNNDD